MLPAVQQISVFSRTDRRVGACAHHASCSNVTRLTSHGPIPIAIDIRWSQRADTLEPVLLLTLPPHNTERHILLDY